MVLTSTLAFPLLAAEPVQKAGQGALKQPADHLQPSADEPEIELESVEISGDEIPVEEKPLAIRLSGDALRLRKADTLGKTLENELGVANGSFGQGVGRPVIRGLTGSRVQMLQSGIGSFDASSISPDHAVALEPLLAEEVRVYKGPETIRYGGGAIGGFVDVEDNRIPMRIPSRWVGGSLESLFDTNADGTSSAAKLDVGGGPLAMHLGGFYRARNDTQIPGETVYTPAVRDQYGVQSFCNTKGKTPNSDSESYGGTVGASWIGEKGMAGLSVGYLDNRYGVPNSGHGAECGLYEDVKLDLEGVDLKGFEDIFYIDGRVRINMRQTRYDFKSELYKPLPLIEKAAFRFGIVDYQHTEFEAGNPFTTFASNASEGRLELDHHWLEAWTGSLGVQWTERDFSAQGVEVFVPQTLQDSLGAFSVQRLNLGAWSFESGLRLEKLHIDPVPDSLPAGLYNRANLPQDLEYFPNSAALSARWDFHKTASATLELNRSKRSPAIQELLSLGPHLAIQTFDVGNIQLANETANTADLTLEWGYQNYQLRVNGFYRWIQDYIYQENTGRFYDIDEQLIRLKCVTLVHCLPIYAYQQQNAEFAGYEVKFKSTLAETPQGMLNLTLFSDYVRGRFADSKSGDVPRMPPLRFGTELDFGNDKWNMSLRYTRAQTQDHPGINETPTPGYNLLFAQANYRLNGPDKSEVWLYIRGNNLLNEQIRASVSFLRNFAPEPGLSVIMGLRASY